MQKLTLVALLAAAPAVAHAQASTSISTSTNARATASGAVNADAQLSVDASLSAARAEHLPTAPIERRAAEGRAKGASEAAVGAAASRALVELRTSHEALVRAGRAHPSDEEVARGASLLARGYAAAQLETVARSAPSDRSLVTAFTVLSELQASGTPTASAVTQVEMHLTARASDDALAHLTQTGAATGAQAGSTVGNVAGSVSGSVTGSASSAATGAASAVPTAAGQVGAGAGVTGSAAAGAAGAAAGVTGTVGGVVGGVVKGKP